MVYPSARTYYDERYRTEREDAFPPDPSRYRSWLCHLLGSDRGHAAVLDYGCGVGYVCSLLADQRFDVVGVDISTTALQMARTREPRVMFMEPNLDGSLPLATASMDIITCLGVLEHISEPEPVIAELRRVARSGASAVWVVPNARSPFFWFGHGTGQVEEYPRTLDGWRELLIDGGWSVEDIRRDPGPVDRPVATWKRLAQSALDRLPLGLTYQFVIETRAT